MTTYNTLAWCKWYRHILYDSPDYQLADKDAKLFWAHIVLVVNEDTGRLDPKKSNAQWLSTRLLLHDAETTQKAMDYWAEVGNITIGSDGALQVNNWGEYQSDPSKRRKKRQDGNQSDTNGKPMVNPDKSIEDKSKVEKKKKEKKETLEELEARLEREASE